MKRFSDSSLALMEPVFLACLDDLPEKCASLTILPIFSTCLSKLLRHGVLQARNHERNAEPQKPPIRHGTSGFRCRSFACALSAWRNGDLAPGIALKERLAHGTTIGIGRNHRRFRACELRVNNLPFLESSPLRVAPCDLTCLLDCGAANYAAAW